MSGICTHCGQPTSEDEFWTRGDGTGICIYVHRRRQFCGALWYSG